ncbi:MAG: pentapeptide repeat-containing protein [Scytonematopsis contorta HA4267-MV1]|nr:pentapeptide repeat-containing protein [Scytonematopsis contorta HA4267-MV1]
MLEQSVKKLITAYQNGERNFPQINLENADLSQLDLSGINLTKANLRKANLSKANFSHANLAGADLQEANLERIDLQSANLSRANLSAANLREAKLDAAKLIGSILIRTCLSCAYMPCVQLVEADLREAKLYRADLRLANLEKSIFERADLSDTILRKVNLQQANLRQAYLQDCNLQFANLTGANLQKADLSNANLDNAILTKTDVRGAEITQAKQANFELAILGDLYENIKHKLHLEIKEGNKSFAFSFDSKILAYCNWRGDVTLVNFMTGEEIIEIDIQSEPVVSVIFNANGKSFDCFFYVNELKLWNPFTGEVLKSLKHHSENVTSIVLDGNGKALGMVGTGEPFELYDVGHETRTFKGYSSGIKTQAISPDGRFTARSAPDINGQIELLDRENANKKIYILTGHEASVQSLAFSPDSKLLVSASAEDIKVWQVEDQKETYNGRQSIRYFRRYAVPTLAFLHTDSLENFILLSNDFFDHIEERGATLSERDRIEYDWNGRSSASSSTSFFAISADRKVLLRRYGEHPIQLWNLETFEELGTINLNAHPLALNYTGNILGARAGKEGEEIILWDVQTNNIIFTLVGHTNFIKTIVFQTNGEMLASGGWDCTIRLWNSQTGDEIKTFSTYSVIKSLAFNPITTILASGHRDGTIKLWDIKTMEEIHSFKAHKDDVEALEFSPNGNYLASNDENMICLWEFKYK